MPSCELPHKPTRKAVSGTMIGLVAGACALSLTVPTTATATPAAPPEDQDRGAAERHPSTGTADAPRHASDGEAPWIAPEQPAGRRTSIVRNEVGWNMAPGIDYRSWEQVDGVRKPIRAHLVTVDIVNPANSFDLLSTTKVAATNPLTWMVSGSGAVAGVNGDFFDIGDTGAPLGVGRGKDGGLRHAPGEGWNSAFWVDKQGNPHVGELPFRGRIKNGHPMIKFTNFNSPVIAKGGIGVYTEDWGRTKGYSVTDGQKRARQVVIKKGRVVSNKFGLTSGQKVKGKVLIGRGRGATLLKKLRKGEKLRLTWRLKGAQPTVAIGGDRPLLLGGQRVVINDRLMHPRTAVGIDVDGNKVFLLTIDGRQAHSRGYTMVELADMMLALGAEDALNLDGGGSTTMVGHSATGQLGVLNLPSDGGLRRVPNGLGVFSDPIS